MNFVLGLILMVSGGKEEDSFKMFMKLSSSPKWIMLGLYEDELSLLKFLEYFTN